MRIVYFHKGEEGEAKTDGLFANARYALKINGDAFELSYEIDSSTEYGELRHLKGTERLRIEPGIMYQLAYATTKTARLIRCDSDMSHTDVRKKFVTVLMTETEILVYVKGRVPDMQNTWNVRLTDQDVFMEVMANHSPDARFIIYTYANTRELRNRINLYRMFALLEYQVDLLTEALLKSGLADDSPIWARLAELNAQSVRKIASRDYEDKQLFYKTTLLNLRSRYKRENEDVKKLVYGTVHDERLAHRIETYLKTKYQLM